MNMIRNPRCMYYIPQEGGKNIQKQKGHRSELDVGEQDVESEDEQDVVGDAEGGVITGAPNNAEHMLQIVTASGSQALSEAYHKELELIIFNQINIDI